MLLGLTVEQVAKRAGIAPITVTHIEAGKSVKDRSLWKLDVGLDWKRGSAEDLLLFGKDADPVELPAEGEVFTDPDEIAIWNVRGLTDRRKREWIAELRVMLTRLARTEETNGAHGQDRSPEAG